jgi:hypothetical protein
MWRLLGLVLWALATCACAQDISLSGVLENKVQVDNRLTRDPRVRGELWGDVDLLATQGKWGAHFTWANQISSLEDDSGSRLYQAYWEKNLPGWGSNLRLGRFQRTDLSGFYILDGGQWNTQWNQWELQAYGGQAKRFDQLFTANIDAIYGIDAAYSGAPNYRLGPVTWRNYRAQLGYQQVYYDNTSHRMQAVLSSQGSLDEKRFWEMNLSGHYQINRSRLENVWFHGFADVTRTLRFRSNFEHYRPRNPLPSFRERFVDAYATGRQSLLRMEAQHVLLQKLSYFIGLQRAARKDIDEEGLGARGGFEYRTGSGRISANYDWLKFGQDSAHSGYLHARHALNSRFEVWANAALRHEDKRLSGINWSYGGGSGFLYQISSAWAINSSLNYIANSQRKSDYIGVFRLIYYLDHFRPKESKCLFDLC